MTRRRFLQLAGLSAASIAGAAAYAWRIEPHWVEVVRLPMPLENLPTTMRGATLAHISDLHIGPVVDDDYIFSALQQVNALRPDMLVCTGDWMTCHSDEQVDHALRIVKAMGPAPLGRYAILGNHDYGRHWSQARAADGITAALMSSGWRVLRNEVVDVQGVRLAGLDDYWSPRYSPQPVLGGMAEGGDRPTVVLCHNPDVCDEEVWGNCRGWILAGHTHGGQCCVPLWGPPMLPVRNRRYTCGAFDVGGGRTLYINRGLGYSRRMRFNARPEITLFTLVEA